jgi:CII-binding regulator of phage lambda lysogenization HflD
VVVIEESALHHRDFTMGLAGFLAGIHSLRILAEKGIADAEDMTVSLDGIRRTLDNMPAGIIPEAQLAGIEQMLDRIQEAAVRAEEKKDV